MHYQFRTRRTIEFAQTDAAGLVHFSSYFLWMESVEHEFLIELGFEPLQQKNGHLAGWPKVNAECSWHAPLRFDDREVEIHLIVNSIRERVIRYAFHFHKTATQGPVHCATGSITAIYAQISAEDQSLQTLAIPAEVLASISVAPEELQIRFAHRD